MHQFLTFILGMKFYMFRTVPLSITSTSSLYTQQWYMSYNFADSLQAGSGRHDFHPDSRKLFPISFAGANSFLNSLAT